MMKSGFVSCILSLLGVFTAHLITVVSICPYCKRRKGKKVRKEAKIG